MYPQERAMNTKHMTASLIVIIEDFIFGLCVVVLSFNSYCGVLFRRKNQDSYFVLQSTANQTAVIIRSFCLVSG